MCSSNLCAQTTYKYSHHVANPPPPHECLSSQDARQTAHFIVPIPIYPPNVAQTRPLAFLSFRHPLGKSLSTLFYSPCRPSSSSSFLSHTPLIRKPLDSSCAKCATQSWRARSLGTWFNDARTLEAVFASTWCLMRQTRRVRMVGCADGRRRKEDPIDKRAKCHLQLS